MPQSLTPQELAYLAGEYTQFAATLSRYQNAHADDPDMDPVALGQQITQLNNIAQTLANEALATLFNDAAQTFANLMKVTAHANQVATSLAQERDQFSRIAAVAASLLALGAALTSGDASGVITAIVGCAKTIHA